MQEPTVAQHMTHAPHTIGHDQPLATAHDLMRKHGIRHLPVLEGGKLVGLVSQRDLYLLETLKDVDLHEAKVADAMVEEIYTVGSRASLRKVAAEMAKHRYGCAIVLEKDRIVGVLSTVDALEALSLLLERMRPAPVGA